MNKERFNLLTLRTPEGIEFSFRLAGPVSRALAWTVDLACISAAGSLAGSLAGILGLVSIDLAQAAFILIYFVISIGYGIILEWYWNGQTVGKRLLGLRVMDARGLRLQFNQLAVRNLLRFVDALPIFYLLGGLACLASRHAQRLGDMAAGTVVARVPVADDPDVGRLFRVRYNSFREHPHLEARLKQKVGIHEAAIALEALIRRDRLQPAARVELFRNLAAYFKGAVRFPETATEGLSDEKYVRNVVDTYYRRAAEMKAVGRG